jgi:hypothetical protein
VSETILPVDDPTRSGGLGAFGFRGFPRFLGAFGVFGASGELGLMERAFLKMCPSG